MQSNKTEAMPIRLKEPAFPTKKLSNIAEDFELEDEIRLPISTRPKRKTMHTSNKLESKLKRIINLNSTRRNKSVQSHNTFYKDTVGPSGFIKPSQLPTLTPVKQRSKNVSVLDQILTRQDDFSKAYFAELHKLEKAKKK